jgi:N-methylhydantoinase B
LNGGKPGASSINLMRLSDDEPFKPVDPVRVLCGPGATVRVETAGGGGWGSALERDPAAVLEDVLDEFITLEAARADYGVAINEKTMQVDMAATAALRARLIAEA